jgi:hypothetical protein
MVTHAAVLLPVRPDARPGHPPGRTSASSRPAWFSVVEDHPDAELLRADARETMLAIAYTLGWSADPETMTTHPTLARCMEVSGKSRRTVQRWWRWLEARSLLYVLEEGTTPRYRPAILRRGDEGNLARTWCLTRPVHSSVTPGFGFKSSPPRARARTGDFDRRYAPDPSPAPPPAVPQARMWPLGQSPQRRSERLAAADSLRRDHLVLRRMSARALRSAVRIYFRSGWSAADILHALDFQPDGSQHIQTEPVRSPGPWIASRLSWWLGDDGQPVRPHSADLRELAERARAEAASERARLQRRPGADPAGYAAQVRAELASRRLSTPPRQPAI